jgi:hypothetical protein
LRPGGYIVTMRIPLAIVRSGGRTAWRAQFVRATVHANAYDVWSYSTQASQVGDATRDGSNARRWTIRSTARPSSTSVHGASSDRHYRYRMRRRISRRSAPATSVPRFIT